MNHSYDNAVQIIKTAILKSQYEAARTVNAKLLALYYGIGKYISLNSRNGVWGKGAIDVISSQLQRELPGLRGFSPRSLRYMRTFYEEWAMFDMSPDSNGENSKLQDGRDLAIATANLPDNSIWQLQLPNCVKIPNKEFLKVGFTLHVVILEKIKSFAERLFYTNGSGNL